MNICVIGAGAIGGWVAGRLALAGEDVMAVASRGRLDTLTLVENNKVETAQFGRFDGPADLLIIATKATSLAQAAQAARPFVGPDTVIVPMLNGVPWWFIDGMPLTSVDPGGLIADALPLDQVIGCVVHAACRRDGDGRIIVSMADKLIIGEPDQRSSDRLTRLYALLHRAHLKPDQTGNVRQAIWYKLWGNATINPLSALTRATCDRILADAECRQWMLEGMAELARIGAAIDCPIAESGEDRMAVTAKLGAFKTSMLQDVEAGRPIELEALLGAPREIARVHNLTTPELDRLYAATKLLSDSLI